MTAKVIAHFEPGVQTLRTFLHISLVVLFCLLSASCNSSQNGAQRLSVLEKVYVALEPASLDSLNSALGPSLSNYGAVTQNDFKPVFKEGSVMVNGSEDYLPLVYTRMENVPSNLLFMPMRPRQLFEAILEKKYLAIGVDRDSGQQFVAFRKDIEAILPELPPSDPLPLEVRRTS